MRRAHLVLAFALSCAADRVGASTPEDAPEPPAGEGWYCFHAVPPSGATWLDEATVCKRTLEDCARVRARAEAADRPILAEVAPPPRSVERPPPAEGALHPICDLDPGACPAVARQNSLRPAIRSSCAPQEAASCAPFYHEFNHWKPGRPTWQQSCHESADDCARFVEPAVGWHLHLVKEACEVAR